jgi:hypothetical protein
MAGELAPDAVNDNNILLSAKSNKIRPQRTLPASRVGLGAKQGTIWGLHIESLLGLWSGDVDSSAR